MTIMIPLPQKNAFNVSIILALFACFLIFYSIWQWVQDWNLAYRSASSFYSEDKTSMMISAIPEAHLFGNALSTTNVPLSDLQLRVTGIVKIVNETKEDMSKVYLSMSGQPSQIYQVGDVLPYGVKVYAISEDAIVLENGGRLEKLMIPRPRSSERG